MRHARRSIAAVAGISICFAIFTTFLNTGCLTGRTLGTPKAPKFPTTPPEVAGQCQRQMDAAKQAIINCGTPLKYTIQAKVTTHKGEQNFDGVWGWRYGAGYVGGLTSYGDITVGCNPNTGGEISDGVLFHEFGHYWLMSNYGIKNHDPKYDSVFNWSWIDKMSTVAHITSTNLNSNMVIDPIYNFIKNK